MATMVRIRDESFSTRDEGGVFDLEVPSESLTVRELIRERVYQEAQDRLVASRQARRALVAPSAEEERLNGVKPRGGLEIDWLAQYETALEAYVEGRIVVLVGDWQTESLDETITVGPDTEVTFLRLVMLVGG